MLKFKPIGPFREIWDSAPASLEQELRDLSSRYFQRCTKIALADEKHATLARLYAGVRRLHQAVEAGDAADAIFEIGSNLIGCEQMALLLVQEQWNSVALIGSVGLDLKEIEAMRMNAKGIMEEAPSDGLYIEDDAEKPDPFLSSLGVTAYVPFWVDSTTKGAIVFFDLLPQRSGLDSADRELLKLLCAYAGPCLSTSRMKNQETFG